MNIVVAEPAPFAAVVVRTTIAALAAELQRGFDHVQAAIDRGVVAATGPRIAVYRRLGAPDAVEASIGVHVSTRFDDVGGIRCLKTPAGRAATALHEGAPAGLPTAHTAILEWANEAGAALAGVSWEVYGPARPDGSEPVEVFHLLDIEPSIVDY